MDSESTVTITQADICNALAFYLSEKVTRYAVTVSKVETDTKSYGTEHFKITFTKSEEASPSRAAEER